MKTSDDRIYIILGKDASEMEEIAVKDLKEDLKQVSDSEIDIVIEKKDLYGKPGVYFLVGSPESSEEIANLSRKEKIPITRESPGPRGGCIAEITSDNDQQKIIILAGSDPQGAQYMVYDFCQKYLKIDPFQFWTGCKPQNIADIRGLSISKEIIEPPEIPILCYFDNDNDELANMTKPYLEFSFEHWKEVIDSLVRLKYNAIDIHDHLGRAEFYRWSFYKQLVPDYQPNEKLLDKVIDYAHKKGVMIQVSFYLGWKFKTISDRANKNYEKHKEEWFTVWRYYLQQTPIGKCDIFLNRPRDQKWDRRYKGADFKTTAKLFNEIFHEMRNILKDHNPDAIIVADLYSEGMKVYKEGFRPEPKEDFIMAWPDDGFGRIPNMPDDLRGYKFGIYMHAGFFLNHVVHDPYPELLSKYMKKAFNEYGMTNYCLVNGQTFRHYLINLEACSKICMRPDEFDPEKFYLQWTERYFGKKAAPGVVQVLMMLHEAQEGGKGYVKIIGRFKESILRLKLMKWIFFLPKKTTIKIFDKFANVGSDFTERVKRNVNILRDAMDLANRLRSEVADQHQFYHDYVILQIKLLLQLNELAYELQLAAYDYQDKSHLKKAIKLLKKHTATRLNGDKDDKWNTWYDPAKRRPNGGYPDVKALEKMI